MLDDDGRERSYHLYVPGRYDLGLASVRWRWRRLHESKTAFGRAGGPIVLSSEATTPLGPLQATAASGGKSAAPAMPLPAWRMQKPPVLPLFRHCAALRLSVALLVCVAQHERGVGQSTVAAITHHFVVSFGEERTYGGLPCPRPLDSTVLARRCPPPRTCDSKKDLADSHWMLIMLGRRMMVGTRPSTARYKSVIAPMRR